MANLSDVEVKILSEIIYLLYSDLSSKDAWEQMLSDIRKVVVSDAIGVTFHDADTGEPTDCVMQDIMQQRFDQYKDVYYFKEPYKDAAISSGIHIYTPEDVISSDTWRKSVFFNELIAIGKRTELLYLDVMKHKKMLLRLAFLKDPRNGLFCDKDKSFLQLLYPHIVQAYEKSLMITESGKIDHIIHSAFEQMHRPYMIMDVHFKPIHVSDAVKELCVLYAKSVDNLIDVLRIPAEPIMKALSLSGFGFQLANISLWDTPYKLTVSRIEQADTASYYILALDEISYQLSQTVKKCAGRFDLSHREIDICVMMMKGMSNREIAEALYISEYTVKDHLKNIFNKLEVNSRSMAIARLFGSA